MDYDLNGSTSFNWFYSQDGPIDGLITDILITQATGNQLKSVFTSNGLFGFYDIIFSDYDDFHIILATLGTGVS